MIEEQLKLFKKFQDKYPNAHVGGSIGLYLRGVELKRNLRYSDLDIKVDKFTPKGGNTMETSFTDFDYSIRVPSKINSTFIKMDIKISDDEPFSVVEYEGINYNVTLKHDILMYKQKYAELGIQKHIDDLITIATGVRPKNKEENKKVDRDDDLPF